VKNGHLLFAVLLLGLCFGETSQAEEPTRFLLDLNRPSPKAGQEAERNVRILFTSIYTNQIQGQEFITNNFHFLELQGHEKILVWDVTNHLSKVEMTVMHFVDCLDGHTNELAKPGTRLTATSIAGETFFHPENGNLPSQAYEQLRLFYNLRPFNQNEFARMKIPQQVSIGETWEIPAPTNFLTKMADIWGAPVTNTVRLTGQFVGITNLFGFNCFYLRYQAVLTDLPEYVHNLKAHGGPMFIKAQGHMTIDLIVPFDTSKNTLRLSSHIDNSRSGDLVIDGKRTHVMQGRDTITLIFEFHPATHP
jgi:hypothetical protein